jgi:hypothetical protein
MNDPIHSAAPISLAHYKIDPGPVGSGSNPDLPSAIEKARHDGYDFERNSSGTSVIQPLYVLVRKLEFCTCN